MKKKRMYVYILMAIAILFAVGLVFNIRSIKEFYINSFAHMTNIWVFIPAAVVAFVFIDNKNYWAIVCGCGIIASILIQLLIVKNGFPIWVILTRTVAFIGIVFAMNCGKLFISNR